MPVKIKAIVIASGKKLIIKAVVFGYLRKADFVPLRFISFAIAIVLWKTLFAEKVNEKNKYFVFLITPNGIERKNQRHTKASKIIGKALNAKISKSDIKFLPELLKCFLIQ